MAAIFKISVYERFYQKVSLPDKNGCRNWLAHCQASGYGTFEVGGRKGKTVYAHRLAYSLNYGEIPKGLFVCHKCDNKKCVEITHLFLATAKQNSEDMCTKGRSASGGGGGAILFPIQVKNIKQKLAGGLSTIRLAKQYHVSRSTISAIKNNKCWRYV